MVAKSSLFLHGYFNFHVMVGISTFVGELFSNNILNIFKFNSLPKPLFFTLLYLFCLTEISEKLEVYYHILLYIFLLGEKVIFQIVLSD